jgi:hypothetical protein
VPRRYDNVVSCSFAEFDIKFIAYYDMQQHIINIKFIGRSGKVSTDDSKPVSKSKGVIP